MSAVQVFQSQSPSRWNRVKWGFRVLLLLFVLFIAAVVFAIYHASNPQIPSFSSQTFIGDSLHPYRGFLSKKYKGFKDYLEHHQEKHNNHSTAEKIRAAFYTPWSTASLTDLRKNADQLNTIYPEWFFIDSVSHRLNNRMDTASIKIMRQNHLSIQPMLTNFLSDLKNPALGKFDPHLASVILHDSLSQTQLITDIVQCLEQNQLQGVNVDFEALEEKKNEPLTWFIQKLSTELHKNGFTLSIDVAAENEDYDYRSLAASVDQLVLMGYDEYSEPGSPGPIAGQKWVEEKMDEVSKFIDPSKIILGVAGYSRDWISNGEKQSINDISYAEAIQTAKLSGIMPSYDNDSYNLHYSYSTQDEDGEKEDHNVWFTDAASTFNSLRFADEYPTAGTALWRLGAEDPRIWTFYGRNLDNESINRSPFNFNLLQEVPYDPSSKPVATGEGELITILYTPEKGKINTGIDSLEWLISEEQYIQLPGSYVYKKFGEDKLPLGPGHKIILTFDDGPDPVYTPQILNILEKEHIPASFFVVGINAEKNIPILQRIYNDGFEIGNHTFTHGNIAHMGKDRSQIELKATRLLIETVTGHSTILFRAPYNADSEPQSFEEIEPIARSKKDNYITVGESIDPNDWDPVNNSDSIYLKTIKLAESTNASIILLHDAGGESRQATVDALPRIIKYFRERGCNFTTVAGLMGKKESEIMPAVPRTFNTSLNYGFAVFSYWGGQFIFGLFIVGICLSVFRMVALAILAFIQKRKETVSNISGIKQGVSIIVPAYNEEVNAVRTVESLLKQDYPILEILFVDDGSRDNTFSVVKEKFKALPEVKVLTKNNGGKASALNFGIDAANYDYVVCIDADTQLRSNAVFELMQKFYAAGNEQEVAAVAGNVKVGNEVNMVSRWQSIEYITSQNFDRRAFDLLNCITVVPGAIGAFKKSAIIESGGFSSDTLAEDCDLTMRLLEHGYSIRNCSTALSYTEVPETLKQFLKQRFRWSFGVMQCFWKHRSALFDRKYKSFGWIALPNILIYQMLLPALAPLADLMLIFGLAASGMGIIQGDVNHILTYYLIFSIVDMAGAALAFSFEKEKAYKLLWMIPQRFIYRQLMYYILFKSFARALKGELQGWGVLNRTGNVKEAVMG